MKVVFKSHAMMIRIFRDVQFQGKEYVATDEATALRIIDHGLYGREFWAAEVEGPTEAIIEALKRPAPRFSQNDAVPWTGRPPLMAPALVGTEVAEPNELTPLEPVKKIEPVEVPPVPVPEVSEKVDLSKLSRVELLSLADTHGIDYAKNTRSVTLRSRLSKVI